MDDSMDLLKRDYLPDDLGPLLNRAGVSGTVVVQARQSLEETGWLLEQAEKHSFIRGVVGWIDLCSAEAERQLDDFASHPRLTGVRHLIHDEPEDDFMKRRDFRRGISRLSQYDLVYDLLIFPRHINLAAGLAREFPEQPFVLDHLGKPEIRSGEIQPWKRDLEALAGCRNVSCKLSGMVTEADHRSWNYEDLKPYMEVALEAFGTQRLMLGSDWPVCLLAGSYSRVLDAALRFTERLSSFEKERIHSQNALDIYRITVKHHGESTA